MDKQNQLRHIERTMTDEERQQAEGIRAAATQDFPPKIVEQPTPPPGIPSRIRDARERRGMTRYELGQIANVPSTVVRAIEQGGDVPLSQFQAVVAALGLAIELVGQS
jgi:ribosome-binding protein aMBF1 (putative translation factor)